MSGPRRQELAGCKEKGMRSANKYLEMKIRVTYTFMPAQKAAEDLWSQV